MNDVGRWLEQNGLGKYADVFAENEIEFDVLPRLNDEDLREMGLPIGPRKKFQAAIDALSSESLPTAEPPMHMGEAERRQLTVMFCDLVGSTALSEGMDPEEFRDIVTAFQSAASREIKNFEGYIARYMGDGLLVYFGYPIAHEDDAELAARAGLALVERFSGRPLIGAVCVAVRIGISTGIVVVGDLVGEGSSEERAVLGDTPNLAARLQGVAPPDTVLVSDATRCLIEGRFQLDSLGRLNLKGFAAPMPAWRLVSEEVADSRFEARHRGQIPEIIGRDQELALLMERWRQAVGGEGQMIVLTGEAGIGKSRISRALIDSLADEQHTRISYQCSPYQSDSALHPVTEHLLRAADFSGGDSLDVNLEKLERLIGLGTMDMESAAPLFAALLGLDGAERYGPLNMTPQQQRRRTLEALSDQPSGLSVSAPVLLIVEDVHWIDPTTLELIELILNKIGDSRVLVLATARPTFQHSFGGHPIVTQLALNRFGRSQTMAMVERLSAGSRLPSELFEEIVKRTDGVPLFVEELTKTVLESELLRQTKDGYVLEGSLSSVTIPTSLHDSLMARLDRHQPVKEVAQTAASIGRDFDYRMLSAISPLPDSELANALTHLVEAELVFCRGEPPDATYTFKHALVRDAAYDSLLRSTRQQIHARIFAALEEVAPHSAEIIAHHATEAGFTEHAVTYWFLAGELARSHSANFEAIAHLRRGISLASELADEQKRARYELNLQFSLGGAYLQMKGHSAPEVEGAFARARELCVRVGDAPELVPTLFGLWRTYVVQMADSEKPEEVAAQLLRLAEEDGSAVSRVVAHYAVGFTAFVMGQFSVARDHLREGIELYSSDDRDTAAVYRFGQDPGVACCCYLALVEWALGYPDKALAHACDGVALARRLEDPFSVAFAHGIASFLDQARGDRDACSEKASEQINVATERAFPYFTGIGQVMDGWAEAVSKPSRAVIQDFGNRIEHHRALGTDLFAPYFLTLLGDVTLRANQVTKCIAALDEAERVLIRTGERWWESETHRLRGAVLVAQGGDGAEAQASFENALAVARRSDARSFELRAAVSLAQLWQQQEKWSEARQLLTPLYNWFTEGHASVDLVLARSVLDELEATGSDAMVD